MKPTFQDLSLSSPSWSPIIRWKRLGWLLVYWLLFRPFFPSFFRTYRNFLLRLFGARIGSHAHIYASCHIWAPWNLSVGYFSCIGPYVECYNQGEITIGNHVVISQRSYLCASSHDYHKIDFPLILCPITIHDECWIAASAFIGPGAVIGHACVVGASTVLCGKLPDYSIAVGNPAKILKIRKPAQA